MCTRKSSHPRFWISLIKVFPSHLVVRVAVRILGETLEMVGKEASCNDPKAELKKGPWSREEDQKLLTYIEQHGHGSWRTLPTKAGIVFVFSWFNICNLTKREILIFYFYFTGLERCGKSCRLRWTNYLRPDIKRGKFSNYEEKTIIRLHALLGNRSFLNIINHNHSLCLFTFQF